MNSLLFTIANILLCSVWMLLLAHNGNSNWLISPIMLLFPTLRIWTSFLIRRRSMLMLAPMVMLSLMGLTSFLDSGPGFFLFIEPWMKLLTSGAAMFGIELEANLNYEYSLPICLIHYVWLLVIPWAVFVYHLHNKQLQPSTLSAWKAIGLCVYIFVATLIAAVLWSVTYKATLVATILALTLLPVPIIFFRGNIKQMFNREEIVYLLTFAMFVIGYVCGIGLELKSAITVCVLPAAFYALINWYVSRETTYKEILLIAGGSIVFWCAQYTTNMARILLLQASLAMMAIPVIRFTIDTKKIWTSVGVYILIALIMPTFCLGYNQYSVLEAKRGWHFDKYIWAQNGLLCVNKENTEGLRDRYGVILPLEYERIELLTSSKPYCKVRKNGMWQIYDIERHELVSDEWFEEIIPYGEYVYRLKSQNGDKYMTIQWYYNPYDKEQSAVISDELPATKMCSK